VRKPIGLMVMLLAVLFAGQAFAQVRVQGTVTDDESKPVKGAKVILQSERGGVVEAVSDSRGKWAAMTQVGGPWNIDIEAEGFVTSRGTLQLSEVQRIPPIKTQLQRVPRQPEPEPEPTVASTVPPEAVEAVRLGEDLLAQERFKEAVVEFEKAQALLPEHIQIRQALARAYYGAGQLDQAVALLKQVHAADPANLGVSLLLINLLLEQGHLEEGKALLEKLPEGTLTDPTAVINIGILFLNKNNPQEAHVHFTRAIGIDPNRGESYYYRGLACLQMQKNKDARADLEKTIALAPDSTEAKDAAELLKQLK
jgi:tetratricopeptide (TPR) repeat protein